MSISLPPILIVDDEKNMRQTLTNMLRDEDYEARAAESGEEALRLLGQEEFMMVITDARMGGMSGYELLAKIQAQWPDLPTLMITAFATPRHAVEAIKAGAIDYLSKPFEPEELLHAIARCAERHCLLKENQTLREKTSESYRLEQIVGDSPKMRELRQMIQTVAKTEGRVLVLGESGTGKELVAGAIHSLSARAKKNYIRINCAAIPETLLESELFGHEKGAFTGALKQKHGRVEESNGGTLFLDEIADMSRPLQAKLLRFLEDGSFTRVGGTQELRVNVRFVAATNRDIVEAIRKGDFREDLFHRLNVVQFRLPPLRERGSDVLLLADHFLQVFAAQMNRSARKLSPAARDKLLAHHWPGNVRELRNVIERALILESSAEVQASSLPDFQIEGRLRGAETPKAVGGSLDEILANYERDLITSMLERNNHSIGKTAEQLKLSRHALRYRLQRLNLTQADADDPQPEAHP
ncbi:MAG: hypothetical protein RLY20_1781 [Verrucomicrobiota bacterium]|jgi:DNA-binding NtrC family response regulator